MIVIFDRAVGSGQIAINAFNVSKVVPTPNSTCTVFLYGGGWETIVGSLEEVIKKLNGFINNE